MMPAERVRWRNRQVLKAALNCPQLLDPEPGSRHNDGNPNQPESRDTYGIHAMVLPRKVYFPGQPEGVRGAVMLWGNGTQHNSDPPDPSDPYVVSYSPFLLWSHQFAYSTDPLMLARQRYRYPLGFLGYTWDPDATPTSDAAIDSGNIFCAGHSLLADGKAFIAGGSQYVPETIEGAQVMNGAKACFTFDPSLWGHSFYVQGQNGHVHSGWTGPHGIYTINDRVGMGSMRWYPSTLLLPSKQVLIVGGTTRNKVLSNDCDQAHRYNSTYLIYHPTASNPADHFVEYPLHTEPCQSGAFHENDQRPTLGGEYPRLRNVTWTTGSSPNLTLHHRAAAVGPDPKIFLLDLAALPNGWQPRPVIESWQHQRRSQGSVVSLPRMDALNPTTVGQQALHQVAQIGGGYIGNNDAWHFDDFITVVTFFGQAEVARTKGPVPPGSQANLRPFPSPQYPGKAHANSTLLPTGDVLITGGMRRREYDSEWNFANDLSHETWLYRADGNGNWTLGQLAPLKAAPDDDSDSPVPNCTEDLNQRVSGQHPTPDAMRGYHSTAVLLPDASVLTAGTDIKRQGAGTPAADCDKYVSRTPSIFYPPYFYRPGTNQLRSANERPRIVAIPREEPWTYGEQIEVEHAHALNYGADVKSVVLVRPSSVTHSVNFDQILVRCMFDENEGEIDGEMTVTLPWEPRIAPPGWYMLFVVDHNDVPSEAKWIRLDFNIEPSMEGELENMGGGDSDQPPIDWPHLEFEMRDLNSERVLSRCSIPMNGLDELGRFSTKVYANLEPGQYKLKVGRYLNWLSKETIVTVGSDRRWSIGGLANGDATGDNVVDAEDLFQIADAAGQLGNGDTRDLNKDGWIDASDLAIALWNLGRQGD